MEQGETRTINYPIGLDPRPAMRLVFRRHAALLVDRLEGGNEEPKAIAEDARRWLSWWDYYEHGQIVVEPGMLEAMRGTMQADPAWPGEAQVGRDETIKTLRELYQRAAEAG
jgi:hypothetical protein